MARKMVHRHSDGNQYVIAVVGDEIKVTELTDLPGSSFKAEAKIEDMYLQNAVWYSLVEDLAILADKDVDEVIDFLTG